MILRKKKKQGTRSVTGIKNSKHEFVIGSSPLICASIELFIPHLHLVQFMGNHFFQFFFSYFLLVLIQNSKFQITNSGYFLNIYILMISHKIPATILILLYGYIKNAVNIAPALHNKSNQLNLQNNMSYN